MQVWYRIQRCSVWRASGVQHPLRGPQWSEAPLHPHRRHHWRRADRHHRCRGDVHHKVGARSSSVVCFLRLRPAECSRFCTDTETCVACFVSSGSVPRTTGGADTNKTLDTFPQTQAPGWFSWFWLFDTFLHHDIFLKINVSYSSFFLGNHKYKKENINVGAFFLSFLAVGCFYKSWVEPTLKRVCVVSFVNHDWSNEPLLIGSFNRVLCPRRRVSTIIASYFQMFLLPFHNKSTSWDVGSGDD